MPRSAHPLTFHLPKNGKLGLSPLSLHGMLVIAWQEGCLEVLMNDRASLGQNPLCYCHTVIGNY